MVKAYNNYYHTHKLPKVQGVQVNDIKVVLDAIDDFKHTSHNLAQVERKYNVSSIYNYLHNKNVMQLYHYYKQQGYSYNLHNY